MIQGGWVRLAQTSFFGGGTSVTSNQTICVSEIGMGLKEKKRAKRSIHYIHSLIVSLLVLIHTLPVAHLVAHVLRCFTQKVEGKYNILRFRYLQ